MDESRGRSDDSLLRILLSAACAGSLVGPVVCVRMPAGARIVREGQPIGTFFMIEEGEVELRRHERLVGRLTAGSCFGEIDPGRGSPQSVTVVAVSPVRVTTIAAAGIARLCEAIPALRRPLEAALTRLLPTPPRDSAGLEQT
jgi:CRP-like cAMP-binding protein